MRGNTNSLLSSRGRCRLKWVSELLDYNGNWDMQRLCQFFLPVDVAQICKIRPSPQLGEDFLSWAPERSGNFSVKSAYWLAANEMLGTSIPSSSSTQDSSRDMWKLIWSCPAPPKVLSFARQVATNSLATWKNKKRRNSEERDTCPIYGREVEGSFHVLCACDKAQQLWKAMTRVWELPRLTDIKRHDDWFIHVVCEADEQQRVRLLMLLWRIWHVRNEVVHSKTAPPVDASVWFLASYYDSLANLRADPDVDYVKGKMVPVHCFPLLRDISDVPIDSCSLWIPPSDGRLKLNTDGSVLNGSAGTSMVLRDHDGNFIFNACRFVYDYDDVLESEIVAIREGLRLALQWSSLPIDVEFDCLEAVAMAKDAGHNLSRHAFLIGEIKQSMGKRVSSITHIRRSHNCVSHAMASFGRRQGRTMVWLGSALDEVLCIASRQCNH
ncbi:retrotransposon unclassified [Hordeum vulgare]|nr:retrotransposon unclassified [Hordeum vulgare]